MVARKPVAPRVLGVGEVAKRSGIAVSAIHFYETKGLISSIRSAGNQRRYTPGVLRYLAIVKVAQRAGISLDEILKVLGPYRPGIKPSAKLWRSVAERWRDSLNERILRLQRLRDEMDGCIGCGCLSLKDCPLRNPDDVLGRQGAGPMILERGDTP